MKYVLCCTCSLKDISFQGLPKLPSHRALQVLSSPVSGQVVALTVAGRVQGCSKAYVSEQVSACRQLLCVSTWALWTNALGLFTCHSWWERHGVLSGNLSKWKKTTFPWRDHWHSFEVKGNTKQPLWFQTDQMDLCWSPKHPILSQNSPWQLKACPLYLQWRLVS